MDFQDHRIHKRLKLNPEIIEEVYSIISEIDSVKNSLHITNNLMPTTIERLTRSVIVTSTGASNRIEGNRLSDDEVENLYKNLRVKKFKTRDEQEIVGYLECLELIFNNYSDIKITESYILSLHNDMLKYSDKDMRQKGNYKYSSNRVEAKDVNGNIVGVIFDPTPPYLVKKEMEELIDWYNFAISNSLKHPLIIISNFIFEYLAIHPFQDGNGRTSRLLTNLMLLQQNYLFSKLVSHESLIELSKIDYYVALNKTQSSWKTDEEDISKWLLFFLKIVKEQSKKTLEIIEKDNIDYLLSEKQLSVWKWINQDKNMEFSRKDIVEKFSYPERTSEQIIKKLLDLKVLNRLGMGRATRYKLKKK